MQPGTLVLTLVAVILSATIGPSLSAAISDPEALNSSVSLGSPQNAPPPAQEGEEGGGKGTEEAKSSPSAPVGNSSTAPSGAAIMEGQQSEESETQQIAGKSSPKPITETKEAIATTTAKPPQVSATSGEARQPSGRTNETGAARAMGPATEAPPSAAGDQAQGNITQKPSLTSDLEVKLVEGEKVKKEPEEPQTKNATSPSPASDENEKGVEMPRPILKTSSSVPSLLNRPEIPPTAPITTTSTLAPQAPTFEIDKGYKLEGGGGGKGILKEDDDDEVEDTGLADGGDESYMEETGDMRPLPRPHHGQGKGIEVGQFHDDEDSHFFAYFLTIMVTAIIFYLVFHNKQRIIALIIEGRAPSSRRRRRSSSRARYTRLDNNLEEAITATKGDKTTSNNDPLQSPQARDTLPCHSKGPGNENQ